MIQADLKGQTALVTGAVSGIGLATATLLAQMGAKVAVNHLPDDPSAGPQIATLRAAGLDVIAAPGNVSKPAEAESMVAAAVAALGGLNYLVNNAGTSGTVEPIPAADLDRLDEAFWQLILNTNLIGPFRCSRAAASALRARRGAIVNIASVAGLGLQGSSTVYAASKSGVVSLTRSLARGLGPEIRVNAVAPGLTNTPWTEPWPEETKQSALAQTALGRNCEPEDIAETVLFLCAGAAQMTGQTVVVDGGMML